jgi:hypothetical protein
MVRQKPFLSHVKILDGSRFATFHEVNASLYHASGARATPRVDELASVGTYGTVTEVPTHVKNGNTSWRMSTHRLDVFHDEIEIEFG